MIRFSWELKILVLLGGFFVSLAQEGVKGGHYHQTSLSQHRNETGYCYRRVPYNPSSSHFNRSREYPEPDHNHGYDSHGNNQNNGYVMIRECCEGYQLNRSTNRCERYSPTQCDGNCYGGVCRNGICNCEPGWYVSEGVCKPFCRNPCGQNAYCFAPDVCECHYGWERSHDGECRPICPGGCENGDCVAPRVCRCRHGYLLDEARHRCEAICEGGCTHGRCIAPGTCECDPGWTNPPGEYESCVRECQPGYISDRHNTCVPECRNTCPEYSQCTAPETCTCDPYYEMDYRNNRCYPQRNTPGGDYQDERHCNRPCLNGICMGQNICSCNEGYVPDPRDPTRTRCVPTCSGGCTNGVCSAPNRCLCNPGYVKDRSTKGSQRCVPQYNY